MGKAVFRRYSVVLEEKWGFKDILRAIYNLKKKVMSQRDYVIWEKKGQGGNLIIRKEKRSFDSI